MGKSQRLLQLMKAVYEKRQFTVKQLAEEFGVSYRTMLRDLESLSELGVPLYSELGVNGGYRVLMERELPPIHWGDAATKNLQTLGLTGRQQKDPEIAYKPEFRIIGLSFTGHYEQLVEEMPKVWANFIHRYEEIPRGVNRDVWLDVAQENKVTRTFTQYVSVEVQSFRTIPAGMVGLTVPAQKYAVFTHTGPMRLVEETYYSAFRWLEAHGYERLPNALRFEVYNHRYIPPLDDPNRETNEYDIYFPIKEGS